MNTSEFLVKCLENEGTKYIFGIPGEENVHFINALEQSTIQFISTADERGAAFMAAAYGRFTGKPGVVVTTIGPGALNTLNGLAYATLGGFPVVALTWQNGVRNNIKSNNFQYVDTLSALKPVTKWQKQLLAPDQIALVIRSAFKEATTPKMGAVQIEIPADVAVEEIENSERPLQLSSVLDLVPSSEDIHTVLNYIEKADCPLIIAGVRSVQEKTPQQLLKFAEKSGVMVISTPMAQGVVPSSHNLSLLSFSVQQRQLIHKALDQVDTVLCVGLDSLEYHPKLWNPLNDKKIIHIDSVPAVLCPNYSPEKELVGDISLMLNALAKSVTFRKINYSLLKKVKKLIATPTSYSEQFPIHPVNLINELKKVSENSIFIHDNGMHKLWMTQFFQPNEPNQVIIDNTLASMASGISQAIVAKLLYPQKNVYVNVGDGGLLMSLGELATVRSLNLDINIIVWRDNGYGMIRWHQEKNHLSSYGTSLFVPNLNVLAESFGGKGFLVESAKQLSAKLNHAQNFKGLSILDCPMDYSDNVKQFLPTHHSFEPLYATQ